MKSAAVIGTGLIGTSIALALTRRGVAVHLRDKSLTAARTAAALGAGTLDPPPGQVDLAVLAVPPGFVGTELARCQERGLARAYTDVASVKSSPQDAITKAGGDPAGYVGGHPMAGGERSGPLAGRADLFEGRLWVLTPSDLTRTSVLNQTLEMVSLCGAVPTVMQATAHDRAVALTSHTPHLVSALLAARLAEAEPDALRVSGQGLRDVTRIAAGSPFMWRDILEANASAVAEVLDALAADLAQTITTLRALAGDDPAGRRHSGAALETLLRRGNAGCARIPQKHGVPRARYVSVPVAITDRSGVLAELLASASASGVNIEDIRIEHSVGSRSGCVELVVESSSAERLRKELSVHGWALRDTRRSDCPDESAGSDDSECDAAGTFHPGQERKVI